MILSAPISTPPLPTPVGYQYFVKEKVFKTSPHSSSPASSHPLHYVSSSPLLDCTACKAGEHKACAVNLLVVVPAQLFLLLWTPCPQWHLHVSIRILTGNHKPNLAGWVSRDGGVCIFGDREDFLHNLFDLGDQRQVKPLVLRRKELDLQKNGYRQPWVVMTPPSRRAL